MSNMDETLQSPTETHTSRSSFNPFANRPTFGGLRDRAGAAFRAIMPKRKRRASEDRRPRTAPYTLRRRQSTTRNDVDKRPATAVTPAVPQTPKVIANEDIATPGDLNLGPDNAADQDGEMAQIPKTLLSKIIELARSKQYIALADATAKNSINELEELDEKIWTVDSNAREMQTWLRDTRDANAQADEDPQSSYRQTDAEITMYEERIDKLEHALDEPNALKKLLKSKIEGLKLEYCQLEDEVLCAVRETWPEHEREPVTNTVADFVVSMPLDASDLTEFEEDYREFSKVIHGEPDPRADYPDTETGDWVPLVLRMRECKEDYEAALSRLEDIRSGKFESEVVDPMDTRSDEELTSQEATVALKAQILADAVEDCRRSGVHVKDDGSEIVNKRGGPFWDMTLHGKEFIIGYMDENLDVHLFGEEPYQPEMTQEEVNAHIARGQYTTQNWLERESLSNDPDEAGPVTPRTPWTPGFRARIRDVKAGETSNRESDSIRIAGMPDEYQEARARWAAIQEQGRDGMDAFINDHKRSINESAGDMWS